MYRILIIFIISIFLAGCPQPQTEKKIIKEIPEEELSDEEIKEDLEISEAIEEKEKVIKEIAQKDLQEKNVVLEEKKVVEEAKVILEKEITEVLQKRAEKKIKRVFENKVQEKIKEDSKIEAKDLEEILVKVAKGEITEQELKKVLVEKLGVSEKEAEEIAKKGGKEALLAKVLEETTTLSKNEIQNVTKEIKQIAEETKELTQKLASATTAKEVREILEEAGDVDEDDIVELSQKTEEIVTQEKDFLRETMAKHYARLQRDRRLQIDDAFCKDIDGILDHILFKPTYFKTDKAKLGSNSLNTIQYDLNLLNPILKDYEDVYIQLEGNTDVRAGNDYNKALGERRWQSPLRILSTIAPEKLVLEGMSRGEECQLERQTGESSNDWWTRNRRTDYMFKLK